MSRALTPSPGPSHTPHSSTSTTTSISQPSQPSQAGPSHLLARPTYTQQSTDPSLSVPLPQSSSSSQPFPTRHAPLSRRTSSTPLIASSSSYTGQGRAGCPLCTIVSTASSHHHHHHHQHRAPSPDRQGYAREPSPSPNASTSFLPETERPPQHVYSQPFERASPSTAGAEGGGGREVVYHDEEITVYRAEGKERLCAGGRHLIVLLNRHLESVYDLGPADIPILSHMIDTVHRLFVSALPSTSSDEERGAKMDVRVGFVGSVVRDPQSPHPHLHAHALMGRIDTSLPGATFWRRNVVFGGVNWWSVEDLRAEIRESTSNNRVKSGYERHLAPIDKVPDAGSVAGLPNILEPDPYTDQPSPVGRAAPLPTATAATSTSMARQDTSSSSAGTAKGKERERDIGEMRVEVGSDTSSPRKERRRELDEAEGEEEAFEEVELPLRG